MENINRFYMIDDILSNKKFNSIINELFIRGTELNIQNINNWRLWSGKTNSLFNLVIHQSYIDNLFFHMLKMLMKQNTNF